MVEPADDMAEFDINLKFIIRCKKSLTVVNGILTPKPEEISMKGALIIALRKAADDLLIQLARPKVENISSENN